MTTRPIVLTLCLIAVAAIAVLVWRQYTSEPAGAFRDFPWTYISEKDCGTDESRVIIHRGEITGPASVTDEASGETAWPAFIHPDPAVVPLVGGKPVIFPVIAQGNSARTPVIPGLKRPLNPGELLGVVRYFTPEGRDRMDAFRTEMGQ
jgi:hypothetical protein